jgi:hypothetical protein
MMTGAQSCPSKLVIAVAIALPVLAVSMHPAEAQSPTGVAVHESPRPLPEIRFENGQGEAMSLADFRGKSCCSTSGLPGARPAGARCRRSSACRPRSVGRISRLVALSIDRKGLPVVKEFYEELGLQELGIHIDASGKGPRELNALGLPTTLVTDRHGQRDRPSRRSRRVGQPRDGALHPGLRRAAVRGSTGPGIGRGAARARRSAAGARPSARDLSFRWLEVPPESFGKENIEMISPETASTTKPSLAQHWVNAVRYWLRSRNGVIVLIMLAVMAGAALNWSWLVAVGIAPLLLTMLPCAAMCAIGLWRTR